MSAGRIESVRIRGFRSLADVELSNLQNANVLIGANGSGKSNFIRFFEMMSWMLRSRRLGEFVERYGGADDQLYGGNSVTPRMEGELALRTDKGRNDYRFALSYAHPDRFIFTEEAYRFSPDRYATDPDWQHVTGGHREAAIVEVAQASSSVGPNPVTARVIVHLLRGCQVFQFHDTSYTSNFKKRWDAEDNDYLRTHGGNLAAVLHRLEEEDVKRFDLICQHVRRVLPIFDRFQVGWRVSSTTVGRLLHRLGYRLQSPRKRQEGATHPDRNAQFEELWEGIIAMEGFWNGQDLRGAPHLGRVTPLLCSGDVVEPAVRDVAGRAAARRTGARLAPRRHRPGWQHDQVACERPADHRSDAVAATRRRVRPG